MLSLDGRLRLPGCALLITRPRTSFFGGSPDRMRAHNQKKKNKKRNRFNTHTYVGGFSGNTPRMGPRRNRPSSSDAARKSLFILVLGGATMSQSAH
jgi:hypothetical protein